MKTIPYKIFLVAFLFSIFACSNKETTTGETSAENIGIPPSLKPEKTEIETIQLSEKEAKELAIVTTKVTLRINDFNIVAPGEVFPAPKRSSIISTPINGQISNIHAFEGQAVKKGQELFQIQSLEFGSLISDYLQAQAESGFQENRFARLQELVKEKISSASELEKAKADFERARALLNSTLAKLKAVGVSEKELQSFNTSDFDPSFKIYAPIGGIVEQNFVELGQSVNAMENLMRILDTKEILIRGYVSPNEAIYISPGDSVMVLKRQQRDVSLKGIISSQNPGLDENTRSVIVNIILQTNNGWPKPGENLRLEIETSTPVESIAIPVEALTYDGDQSVIFVKKSETQFEKREIKIREIRNQLVFVESGLFENEEIAISNVFSLKALSRFDIIAE